MALGVALADSRLASGGVVSRDDWPDIWAPIREAIPQLLPHLSFQRFDLYEEDRVRLHFERRDATGTALVELDSLSAGEKGLLLLVLPLLEAQVRDLLRHLGRSPDDPPADASRIPTVVLIDEPEQHLHSELESRLLRFLRRRVDELGEQFILATHSRTLLEEASSEELFALLPPSADGDNQLKRVASTDERLELLRSVRGEVSFLTSGLPILLVEGEALKRGGMTDVEILRTIAPGRSSRYHVVPAGSWWGVARLVQELRRHAETEGLGITVHGIVDRDRRTQGPTVAWPVCSIENLLVLDLNAVAEALSVLAGRGVDITAASQFLETAARRMRDHEIRVRIKERFPPRQLALDCLPDARGLAAAVEGTAHPCTEGEAAILIREASLEVDQALHDGHFVEAFRGKELLGALLDEVRGALACQQLSLKALTRALAMAAARSDTVQRVVAEVFDKLEQATGGFKSADVVSPRP